MEAVKNSILWITAVTNPMREWKYGEDGKYVHILLGMLLNSLAVMLSLITKAEDLNAVGLSFLALTAGVFLEVVQKLIGGKNTFVEATLDAMWFWIGGNLIAYSAFYFELARFAY